MAMGQSKLDDLAEKSAQKNGGTSAHYIAANQALRDDLVPVSRQIVRLQQFVCYCMIFEVSTE